MSATRATRTLTSMTITETGTRAREPDEHGYATSHDGLRLYWEIHGRGETTIALLPPAPISHSRAWKAQVHYLARHFRVVVYDGRGNGNSDIPDLARPWHDGWLAADCLAVLDATQTGPAVLAGICGDGVWPSLQIAAAHPDRVLGIVALAPGVPFLTPPNPWRAAALASFEDEIDAPVGWQKHNRRYLLQDWRGFLEFFFGEMFPEPHSTKQVEDMVAYGLDGPVEANLLDHIEPVAATKEEVEAICRQVRCPVLVVQGDRDNCQPFSRGLALAELLGAEHVHLEGAGHLPSGRHPVLINGLFRDFASRFDPAAPERRTWVPAAARRGARCSSPRRSGSAMPGATSRSRGSCGAACRASRSSAQLREERADVQRDDHPEGNRDEDGWNGGDLDEEPDLVDELGARPWTSEQDMQCDSRPIANI